LIKTIKSSNLFWNDVQIYENNDKQNHSVFLNEHFNISNIGVDYYNPNNIPIEFKESFNPIYKNVRFSIPEYQTKESKYFVLCLNISEYFILRTRDILNRFTFDSKYHLTHIRLSTIRIMKIAKFDDILELKTYINNLNDYRGK